MNNQMQDGMVEVTRLTRQGRLAEATAIIQRTLGGTSAPDTSPERNTDRTDEPVETSFWGVDETSRSTAPAQPVTAKKHALRPAPKLLRRFRNVPYPSGGLPGTMPGATAGVLTPSIVPAGGRFVERSYADRAGTRAYKLYIPSGYVEQAVPLVVMLHGCTQSPDDFAAGTRMNVLAEKHTFLVAYPAQDAAANGSKCWNWFEADDQHRGQGEPSLIAGITREILDEYNVATDRVYVAGMSAGGAMAAIMGATYPDLYTAVGVHSGLPPGAAHDLASGFAAMRQGGPGVIRENAHIMAAARDYARILPAIVFHGDRDMTVHPQNADHLLAYYWAANTAGGRGATSDSVPRATKRQGRVPDGYSYTCATYHDAGDRVIAEQWTIHGLGHAWSGGSLPGSYTDPKGPDASAEMVRFFLQHPQREPS